jgi:hypothetical protein
MGRDSSVGIVTGYGLNGWGLNEGVVEIFRSCPNRPCGPPSLFYYGYRVFPNGNTARPWHLPPTPSDADVNERVKLYSTLALSPRGFCRLNFSSGSGMWEYGVDRAGSG